MTHQAILHLARERIQEYRDFANGEVSCVIKFCMVCGEARKTPDDDIPERCGTRSR